MLALLTFACVADTTPAPDDSAPGATDTDTTPESTFEVPAVEVVSFLTADGVTLAADWYAHAPGAPAVILLHMIPPTYDRTSWPVDFIELLRTDGYAVLAVDRRGAGDSGGTAVDAYEGDLGVEDANAAADFLTGLGFDRLAVIGASNGTTTTLDYAASAADTGRPVPWALTFMSGGSYTENNTRLSRLDADALFFVYPEEEASWNEEQAALDPGTWTFQSYARGDHGTFMFDAVPTVRDDLRAFLAASLDVASG